MVRASVPRAVCTGTGRSGLHPSTYCDAGDKKDRMNGKQKEKESFPGPSAQFVHAGKWQARQALPCNLQSRGQGRYECTLEYYHRYTTPYTLH